MALYPHFESPKLTVTSECSKIFQEPLWKLIPKTQEKAVISPLLHFCPFIDNTLIIKWKNDKDFKLITHGYLVCDAFIIQLKPL